MPRTRRQESPRATARRLIEEERRANEQRADEPRDRWLAKYKPLKVWVRDRVRESAREAGQDGLDSPERIEQMRAMAWRLVGIAEDLPGIDLTRAEDIERVEEADRATYAAFACEECGRTPFTHEVSWDPVYEEVARWWLLHKIAGMEPPFEAPTYE